ncbi:hypothetical protein WK13_34515 [Burkholderia ubonensis]|nr:hypothetical protein WK13_34515 [Burkholderia ubonensis]
MPDASLDLNGGPMGAPASKDRAVPQTEDELDAVLEQGGVPRTEAQVAGEAKFAADGRRLKPTADEVEFRRKQVLRLVLSGVATKTIAAHLSMSIRQVNEDRMALKTAMKEELRNFDYPTYIGMSMALYDEVRSQALRMAMDPKREGKVQVAALQVAMRAEDSKHNFLTRVGLFKTVAPTDPFSAINTGRHGSYSDENDVNAFLQLIANSGGTKDMGEAEQVGAARPCN